MSELLRRSAMLAAVVLAASVARAGGSSSTARRSASPPRIPCRAATTSAWGWSCTSTSSGERRDGSLWVHWGDRLFLLPRGQAPRSVDLEPLLQRGTEWADAARYVPSPESLWIGLDGRGRSYVRVDLADADRRSVPWHD